MARVYRVKNYRRDDDHAAEKRPIRGRFADKKENPNGIQKRLDKAYNAGVERANAFGDAFCKEHVRDADLENTEKKDRKNVFYGNRGRRIICYQRDHQKDDQNIAVENGKRRVSVCERARMPQKSKIQTEENARSQSDDVSDETLGLDLSDKKQAHAE